MTLYMKTTTDKYELPIAVADSGAELARMLGVTVNSVWSCISKHRSGYHKIEIEEVEQDESTLLI